MSISGGAVKKALKGSKISREIVFVTEKVWIHGLSSESLGFSTQSLLNLMSALCVHLCTKRWNEVTLKQMNGLPACCSYREGC